MIMADGTRADLAVHTGVVQARLTKVASHAGLLGQRATAVDGVGGLQYGGVMPGKHLTLADLRKAGTITSLEIVAAIDAYIRNSTAGPYRFASGHSLEIAKAIEASPEFAEMMARPGPKEKTFRTAVTMVAMSAHLTLP
jgi:hypothetical protein